MTEVKICGITNQEDALCAIQCGAAALGFIFYPPSSRYIKPDEAKKIISSLPEQIVRVGVFVNEASVDIKRMLEFCKLDMLQLHGDESAEFCREFPASRIIKAVELKNEDDLNQAFQYDVTAILLDSRHAGLYGGTGKQSNWEMACRIKDKKLLILSGGLNEGNIVEALQRVAPAALDINSGVEMSPGKKDHAKLKKIFNMIKEADTATKDSPIIFTKREI
ncbi:MAG: phosphoribosylanthranilate isomerase [Smithella sp.]